METRSLLESIGSVSPGALLVAALAAPVAGQATERVSVDSSGAQGNSSSEYPSISADGRYVAFESSASNLVIGDTNGYRDVFVRDHQSGTTERVSVSSGGVEGNGPSYNPSISAEGCFVAFWSYARDLVSGDTNGTGDVFVRDRQSDTTERVSVDSSEAQGNGQSQYPSISADGRFVAFESSASNLFSGDTNGNYDIFVRDRQSGTTERVSVNSLEVQANGDSYSPSISADGRYVAFWSFATNLVIGDTNGIPDVFVRDRQSGTTELVSVDSGGAQGNSFSESPSISADGCYVAFWSSATNLIGGDTNLSREVFVRDRQSGTTERVSVDSLGAQGNNQSSDPSISADGRYVAFWSNATNLVSGDTNGTHDVFVRDRCSSAATSATFSGDGINAETIAPVNAVLGSSWSAPLTLGHPHGSGGPLSLKVRSATINGLNFVSPVGGRLTEILVTGPFLITISGSHNGVSGDVPTQTIPDQFSLVGVPWAAQYTVVGGGFGDLSQAVFGIVGCQ